MYDVGMTNSATAASLTAEMSTADLAEAWVRLTVRAAQGEDVSAAKMTLWRALRDRGWSRGDVTALSAKAKARLA